VQSFKLFDLELQASIKENDNIANVKVNRIYPLSAEVDFQGNMDAFKLYHPLKAAARLRADVYYKDALDIKAELFSMGAVAKVKVKEEGDAWAVDANISHLDLQELQKQNNLSLHSSGLVDIDVDFHTQKDSLITLTSKKAKVYKQSLKNARFELRSHEGLIQAYALFKAEDIDYKGIWFNYDEKRGGFDGKVDLRFKKDKKPFIINLKGEHKNSTVFANADASVSNSDIDIKDIRYDLNTSEGRASVELNLKEIEKHEMILDLLGVDLQGDFHAKAELSYKDDSVLMDVRTQSLGGDLSVLYKNKTVQWRATKLSLTKLAHLFKAEEKLSAKLDSHGTYDKDRLQAQLHSKLLSVGKTEIEDIQISAHGDIKDLHLQMRLKTDDAIIHNSSTQIKDFQDVQLEAKISTPYTSKPVSLEANASYTKALSTLSLQATSDQLSLVIPQATYKDEKLGGSYRAEIEPSLSTLKNKIHLDGRFSYDKAFMFLANTKDFGGLVKAELSDEHIKLNASQVKIQKVLHSLKQPTYAHGNFDLKAEGTVDKIDFDLKAKKLRLSKQETGLDENLSTRIKGRLSSSKLVLWPQLTSRHLNTKKGEVHLDLADKKVNITLPLTLKREKEKLAVVLKSRLELNKEIKAELLLEHRQDRFSVKKLIYKDQSLKADLSLDIKKLQAYNRVSKQELYGPMDISGNIGYSGDKVNLHLSTNTLGGRFDLNVKDKDLQLDLENLSAVKIGRLRKEKGVISRGNFNGQLSYNIERKQGKLDLSAQDIVVLGIDIDKSLKEINDVLGLNIFAMGKTLISKRRLISDDLNLTTEVQQAALDVDITPELIISRDMALRTKDNRFAVHASVAHDGEIKDFEVAILDLQGCAILTQKLKGNISNPKLTGSQGAAVVILSQAPKQIVKTGGKIIDMGAGFLDSTASLIWKHGLRQDSKVTIIDDTLSRGGDVLSLGKDIVVRGNCKVFYSGEVKHPE